MKKSMGLLFSTALLGVGLATVATTATVHAVDANDETIATQKVTVSDKTGTVYRLASETAVPGYKDVALTQATGSNIQGSTTGHAWLQTYQYDQVAQDASGAVLAYHFTGGWAAAKSFSATDPTTYKVNSARGTGAINHTEAVKVYSDPQLTKATGKTLAGGSQWQYFATYDAMVTNNGSSSVADTLAYNLGGNQWVSAAEFVVGTAPDFYIYPNASTVMVTATKGVMIYSDLALTKPTGRVLPLGSKWRSNGVLMSKENGAMGLSLGGPQFIKPDDVGTLQSERGVFTVRYAAHPTWGIAVYNSKMQVTKTIPAGSRWQAFSSLDRTKRGSQDLQIYLNIGGDQWVRKDYGTLADK